MGNGQTKESEKLKEESDESKKEPEESKEKPDESREESCKLEKCSERSQGQRNLEEMMKKLEFSEETIQKKLTTVFVKKKRPSSSILDESGKTCKRVDDAISKRTYDYYIEYAVELCEVLQILGFNLPLDLQNVPKILTKFLRKTHEYTDLQKYEDLKLRSKAFSVIEHLYHYHDSMNCLDTATREGVDLLEYKNVTSETKDSMSLLGELKLKTKDFLTRSDIISACRATAYVNLYFIIAVLRTLVLWQVLYLQLRKNFDHTNMKYVIAFKDRCKEADLELFRFVTKIDMKNVMFFSVFNSTENEHLLYFMELYNQECYLPRLSQAGYLACRFHVICLFMELNMKLKLPKNIKNCIGGTNDNHSEDALELNLRAVKGRDLDNVFFLRSKMEIEKKTEDVYITMDNRNAYCYFKKEMPGSEGQWKLLKFDDGDNMSLENRKFIISSLKWPGQFLYLFKSLRGYWLACTDDLEKVKEEGMWKLQITDTILSSKEKMSGTQTDHPTEPLPESVSLTGKIKSIFRKYKKLSAENYKIWLPAIIVICIAMAITSISFVSDYNPPLTKQPPQTVNSASNQQVHPVEIFRKEFKDLKSKFIAQDTDFWKRIRVPVLRVIREEEPDYPAVVLLVVPKGESTSKTATCLAKQYRSVIGKVYTGGKKPEKGYINVQTISKSSLKDSKYLLDHEIIELFNSSKTDKNAVVIDHIEDLDPNVMLLFSGYCDGNHAPYKKAVFVFVLHTDLEIKASKNLDKTVDHYLQTLWGKNLGNDKIPNLIARVANNKAMIHGENISSLTMSRC